MERLENRYNSRVLEDLFMSKATRFHRVERYTITYRDIMHPDNQDIAYSSSESAIGALEPGFMSFTPIPMSSTGAGANFN